MYYSTSRKRYTNRKEQYIRGGEHNHVRRDKIFQSKLVAHELPATQCVVLDLLFFISLFHENV